MCLSQYKELCLNTEDFFVSIYSCIFCCWCKATWLSQNQPCDLLVALIGPFNRSTSVDQRSLSSQGAFSECKLMGCRAVRQRLDSSIYGADGGEIGLKLRIWLMSYRLGLHDDIKGFLGADEVPAVCPPDSPVLIHTTGGAFPIVEDAQAEQKATVVKSAYPSEMSWHDLFQCVPFIRTSPCAPRPPLMVWYQYQYYLWNSIPTLFNKRSGLKVLAAIISSHCPRLRRNKDIFNLLPAECYVLCNSCQAV